MSRMDDPSQYSVIGALLTFVLGGGAVAVLTAFLGKNKTNAEAKLANANADQLIIGSALEFVNTLKSEVVDLRKAIDELEQKIEALESHVRLQSGMIFRLRDALQTVKPDHPMLNEKLPILEL